MAYDTPGTLEPFIYRFFDAGWEPGLEAYREHCAALNEIMTESGVPMEGSLFTPHLPEQLSSEPLPELRDKRRNFALFASAGSSLLEIGFNGGHSCMLALTINPELTYTGVDIGHHAYSRPCFDYLKSVFGERVSMRWGDSREVLPAMRRADTKFELYHIDGGHGFGVAHADLANVLALSRHPATLMMDDTGHPDIDALCDFYVMQGRLSRIEFKRLWTETINHRMFRTHPEV